MIDILIKNGTIFDGTGAPRFQADLAITDGVISDILPLPNESSLGIQAEAHTIIDATHRFVTPGFIDTHGHSDVNVLANPNAESKLRQGITTEIISNCGDGVFPLIGEALKDVVTCNESLGVAINWSTVNEYFDLIDKVSPAINIASYVGHSTIRLAIIGDEDRQPTPDELNRMQQEVAIAMEAGSIGLSTGLIYPPGLFADQEEIITLQKIVAKYGGIYASHVRGEGDTLLEAAVEFENIIRSTGSQGQFSHLKASGPKNWGKVQRVIDQIESINSDGLEVYFDKYPYIASSTSLQSLLSRWVLNGGKTKAMKRLCDPSLVSQIVEEAKLNNEGKDGWHSVLICQAHCEQFDQFQGKSIGEIADYFGVSGDEMFVRLLIEGNMLTSICNFTMCQDETDLALTHPLGMPGSDAGCRAPYGVLSFDTPHPRAYGTFGKYFRDYVKERQLLSVEDAVYRCTGMPSRVFGLKNRGVIAKGYHADVLVMDFENFEDKATFVQPHQYCTGLDAIIVNGVLTLHDGKQTGKRAGIALRKR